MAQLVKIGPWGGNGGNSRDITGSPIFLKKIVIRSGTAIDSLEFEYVENGKTYTAGPWGGSGGNPTTIKFEQDEFLIEVIGTTGRFDNGPIILTSLTFVTNRERKFGPLGVEKGTPFSVPIEQGRLVAFFGRFGTYVDAIGISLIWIPPLMQN